MRLPIWLILAGACGSDLRTHTRAFVASTGCGQGPFELHVKLDGTTGGDGVEIVACTPRQLAGHVEVSLGTFQLVDETYGDVADNARCVGGGTPIVTAPASGGPSASSEAGAGGAAHGELPALVERPYTGGEPSFADELCKPMGLTAQQIVGQVVLSRTPDDAIGRDAELRVKLWSDAPNDLQGVVFLVRQLTSTKTKQQVAKEEQQREREERAHPHRDAPPPSSPAPDHGAPPAPLVEQRPPAPVATATWIPGYWTWTGSAWGWVAGFWRDERLAIPAPRIELPGAPPVPAAVWIGGAWQLRAGSWVWVRGRWR